MAKMLERPVPEGSRSVSWPWYHHILTNELTLEARNVFTEYSKIPPQNLESHIYSIVLPHLPPPFPYLPAPEADTVPLHQRDKAWGIFPWPCIGEFWFLSFGLSLHPLYQPLLLPRLRSGATFLDLGSCLGQDVRKCIFDGASPHNLYASDLFPEYEALAYELWRDADTFPRGHFMADDILASNEEFTKGRLMTLLGPGGCDVIAITMFLHLFDYKNQLKAATRILRLLAHKPGSLVLGSQAGSTAPGEVALKPPFAEVEGSGAGKGEGEGNREKRTVFRHNPESFEGLWREAGRAAGVPLKVSAGFHAPQDFGKVKAVDEGFDVEAKEKRYFSGAETRRLYFSVMRT